MSAPSSTAGLAAIRAGRALPPPAEDFQAIARRVQAVNDRLIADMAILTGLTPAAVRVQYFDGSEQ